MPSLIPAALLAHARSRVAGKQGPRLWRALEELVDEPAFRAGLEASMPQLSSALGMDRRRFLQLLGASLAFGGLVACSGVPGDQIVPWTVQPPGTEPDAPRFYATALDYAGDVLGVLVETRSGRPTKIEGNPHHPASLGATGPVPQAAVLELWDPDRSPVPLHRGRPSTWEAFAQMASGLLDRYGNGGNGLHVLSGRVRSPTLAAQRETWWERFPDGQWHEYEAVGSENAEQGARLAFGRALAPRYHFEHADIILSLEADFLGSMPGRVAHARAFAARREPSPTMCRLYAVEATPSLTGAMADHCWPLRSTDIAAFAWDIAMVLGVASAAAMGGSVPGPRAQALAADLAAHRGHSLVIAGESQPPPVHALAHLLNQQLDNVGHTVDYLPVASDDVGNLQTLVDAIHAGEVQTLLLLDNNIAYAAPADVSLTELLKAVPQVIHWGLYADESAALADWHLPASHALESWSDLRAQDGTISIVQPLIEPLYRSRSAHELLALLMGASVQDGMSIVQRQWQAQLGDAASPAWRDSLQSGIAARAMDTAPGPQVRTEFLAAWQQTAAADDSLELVFRPDPTIWDGRYANNGWLQELPKPLTQLTWSNAALISPTLAAAEGLGNGDVVALELGGRRVAAPVWIMPGQAERSVTVHLGYGRRAAGRVGSALGFDAYALRTQAHAWTARGLTLVKTGRHVELASTQQHFRMDESSPPVRSFALAQWLADPDALKREAVAPPSFYPEQAQGDYAWGMTVDLNACIGCKGCTVACQAENNIPVVGADQVRRGREMHWIRVDRYYSGAPEHPFVHHQPVPCMHCEHAPCELVCPVGATVHDAEGLNVQVYNRCVGTRFCSNNCPYKVRRFNFLQFSDLNSETLKAQRNPDVTVRNRGVMEKCTYCIQRIEEAHIAADKAQRRIADGEVVTACQAACPTQAIRFGNIHDADSAVAKAKASPRNYQLLQELNTRPRTSYLASVRNPNPALGEDV